MDLSARVDRVRQLEPIRCTGSVTQVVGLTIEAEGISSRVGEICEIVPGGSSRSIPAEVVGFRDRRVLLMPFGTMDGIRPGTPVRANGGVFGVPVGDELLGRVIDGLGRPIDDLGPITATRRYPTTSDSPHPLQRSRIQDVLTTGVRAVDGLLTVGRGQRIGIFAGSGVGKSTLLGMIARNTESDISVIGLIGERGREVREFIERDLGLEGLKKSVVVVSTSDQPALVRLKGAWVATAIAEYFRDRGRDVTLMMDSVTRFAMAQRELGLAVGEPPASKGYTPSVFALLPRLMERAGTSNTGTITAFYTVLVEADDLNEPITDTARSILDGHIVLSRDLAAENHYPAIDVLGSVSRVMTDVTSPEHRQWAGNVRETMAVYANARDLINIGAYVRGSNPRIDAAIRDMPAVTRFLRQTPDEKSAWDETLTQLSGLCPE
ncbi:MAG: flagellar protein export ATPase FliI [Chloroflexota bacterium]|nr:MAG: flagellar protein export ATPase FliI [Chloroflexota bacterium]